MPSLVGTLSTGPVIRSPPNFEDCIIPETRTLQCVQTRVKIHQRNTGPQIRVFPKCPRSAMQLSATCDASWASDKLTRQSCGGALIYFGPYLIGFYSKAIKTVATSSAHAETLEISRTGRSLQTLKSMVEELGFKQGPMEIRTCGQFRRSQALRRLH